MIIRKTVLSLYIVFIKRESGVLSFTTASQAFSPMNSLFKIHIQIFFSSVVNGVLIPIQWVTELKLLSHCFYLFKIFNYLHLSGLKILRNFHDVVSSVMHLGELGNLPQSQLRFDHVQIQGGASREVGKE